MSARTSQPSILAAPPAYGRSVLYRIAAGADPRDGLERLRAGFEIAWGTVGIGLPLVASLGREIAGLRPFPALAGPGVAVPSTEHALWLYLGGPGRSEVYDRAEAAEALLGEAFRRESAVDTFLYRDSRDLTGYEDGSANPKGEDAVAAALGPDGSSFAAVQRWEHDLRRFRSHAPAEQDAMIGRNRETNEELEDAPETAHVKRTEQEDYDPPAFMLRRSMPFADPDRRGLEFVAYGATLDAFERVLRRMAGLDDGMTDALFRFSRPVAGGYYWCPPVSGSRLDLGALGV